MGVLELRLGNGKVVRGFVGDGGGVAALDDNDSNDFRRCNGERGKRADGDGVRLRFSATLMVYAPGVAAMVVEKF